MDGPDPFARLHLAGGRFDGAGMPLEALVELAAYRELVLGVAKEVFRSENPGRRRVPRGFTDRLDLRLRRIEGGSAMPVLERMPPPGALLSAEDEFSQSRDLIAAAIAATAADEVLPELFPRRALVLFNRFGQTLRETESIELRSGSASSGPCYTSALRRKLVLNQATSYQQEVDDIGWVYEVDANRMSCSIRLRSGPSLPVSAPLDEVTFLPVKEVLEPNGEGPPVRVSGVGVYHATKGLVRLDSLHDVSLLDIADELETLDARLDELAQLRGGWMDGDGTRPDPGALRRARVILADLLSPETPRPRVFPTVEGAVQAEWTIDAREVSVTFEPSGGLYVIAVDVASGEVSESELESDDPGEVARLLGRA